MEVLAPVGSPAALDAAIACGADAVYLGTGHFNARRNAQNFTELDLPDVVRRCHIAGVHVYLALNILLRPDEKDELVRAARSACEAGVDAVIVQDLGVAEILRLCAPQLRMHASTQMVVHNLEGVRLLEEMGFSRVVLARECSLEETAKICAGTALEVEAFVHGAMCMSVSGSCYMSSIFGQRSGNRGLCAQPCRLSFQSRNTEYALSLKDMSLLSHADKLRAAGVYSMKIEGRMKRPEYVAAAVTACQQAANGQDYDLDSLRAVFSRSGFTDGYFTGEINRDMFGIRQKEDVTAAAGVLSSLANLYNQPKNHIQKSEIAVHFRMQKDVPSSLLVRDEQGREVSVSGEIPQIAQNRATDEERAKAALLKTGGTPYRVAEIQCEIEDGLVLAASAMNAMRRDALQKLDDLRGALRPIPFDESKFPQIAPATFPAKLPEIRIAAALAEQVTSEMVGSAQQISLPPQALLEYLQQHPDAPAEKFAVELPRLLFSGQEKLEEELKSLWELGVRHACAGNLGALEIARRMGFVLHGQAFLNAVNSYAVDRLVALGCEDVELSFETSLEMIGKIDSPVPIGAIAYGHLPLMAVRNCPVRSFVGCSRCRQGENYITDRKGNRMVTSCARGYAEVLNPVPLYMAERMNELKKLQFVTLRFTTESPEKAAEIFTRYQTGAASEESFTRGLFYKTIL